MHVRVWVHVCLYPRSLANDLDPQKRAAGPELELPMVVGPTCGYGKHNLGPLQTHVLLTTETFLQV